MYSLWFVQWDFTRRDHPKNIGRVSGSGLVSGPLKSSMTGLWDEWIGPSLWAGARGLGVSLDAPQLWAWRVGLRAHFSNLIKHYLNFIKYVIFLQYRKLFIFYYQWLD